MKSAFIVLCIFLSSISKAQTSAITVSMSGIGDIKVGMKKAEFEKLTGQSLKLKRLLGKDTWERDTFNITYKDVPMQVVLSKEFVDENKSEISVWEVRSSSQAIKTRSGIGIGDDKLKVISTYNDYTIYIMPEYENNYTVKSKTKSTIWLHGDESGKVIIFYLDGGKVTGMSVTFYEGC